MRSSKDDVTDCRQLMFRRVHSITDHERNNVQLFSGLPTVQKRFSPYLWLKSLLGNSSYLFSNFDLWPICTCGDVVHGKYAAWSGGWCGSQTPARRRGVRHNLLSLSLPHCKGHVILKESVLTWWSHLLYSWEVNGGHVWHRLVSACDSNVKVSSLSVRHA